MPRRLSRFANNVWRRRLTLELLERRDVPSFFGTAAYAGGNQARALAAGDFNGDSLGDVAVASYGGSGGVSILLAQGPARCSPALIIPPVSIPARSRLEM